MCQFWYDQVRKLAKKELWYLIQPCQECADSSYRFEAAKFICSGIHRGGQAAIERLYPEGVDWKALFLQIYDDRNFDCFVYLTQNGLLDPNSSHLFAEQILMQRENKWEAQMEYYISIGGNINLQDENGVSLIGTMLMCQRMNIHNANVDYLKRIRFLLNNGADPMLEDHSGMTSLEFARDYMQDYSETIHALEEFV